MATNKIRVNLYVDRDMHARLKAAVGRIPGLNVSLLFENSMREATPHLEKLGDAIESGNGQAAMEAMQIMMGQAVETVGVQMSAVRTKLEEGEKIRSG
jgi:post-segregation antitoxin (ccd killing protein)